MFVDVHLQHVQHRADVLLELLRLAVLSQLVAIVFHENQAFQRLALLPEQSRQFLHLADKAFLPEAGAQFQLFVEVAGKAVAILDDAVQEFDMLLAKVNRKLFEDLLDHAQQHKLTETLRSVRI